MNWHTKTSIKQNPWSGAAMAFVALAAAGCTTLRMVPPQDLVRASDEFAATERSRWSPSGSFALGPYRVAEVDRDWTRSNTLVVFGHTSSTSETGYVFQFREGEETLVAQCAQFTHQSGYNFVVVEMGTSATSLICICGDGVFAARLEMEGPYEAFTGRVTLGSDTFDVKPVHDINAAWNVSEPSGFRVDMQGEPLGGVEVLHPGRIWLSKGLGTGERRQLGCLLAGLMLYDPPSAD